MEQIEFDVASPVEGNDIMSDDARPGELEFPAAREQVEKAVEQHLSPMGAGIEMPRFELERGMVRFSFAPITSNKQLLFDALAVIKQHIENVRIHTFETGYIIFQAMGDNIYDRSTNSISDGIKFKFSAIGGNFRVEVQRKANLIQDEVLACVNLFKMYHPTQSNQDPLEKFSGLGVSVWQTATPGPAGISPQTESQADTGSGASGEQSEEFIAGYEKTKLEIQENVILPLQHAEVFRGVAGLTRGRAVDNLPGAILFEGPPGVGKTTMARIIARETGIPLVYVPVENILSKYYGESAQNLAAVFDAAREMDKVILFLDEIDSLAGSREQGMFEATRRVLSVLLRKIDGFEKKEGVLTIGATNRSNDLDNALLSRFDQIINFPLPDAAERAAIFGGYARHLTREELASLAEDSAGFSGRNIQDICEYAERRWARILIAEKKALSVPPVALYLEVIREKARRDAHAAESA